MTTYLLAGGGTAGHVNPLLAVADLIRATEPDSIILVLGTREGLEARLVPARGYELVFVPRVPFPRRPGKAALSFLPRFRRAIALVSEVIRSRQVDVVVGFGGYVATPAYLAARRTRVPIVIHEANAKPGLANKLGALSSRHVGVAFPGTAIRHAQVVGMPLRPEIEHLDRTAERAAALSFFELSADRKTLLVTGGSLGALRLNTTVFDAAPALVAAGWQVLHITGERSELPDPDIGHYRMLPYCDRMDLALSVADFAISRAGAATVSELSALGVPAVYVPYPVGNGEQRLNAAGVVAAGGGILVDDAEFLPGWIRSTLLPVLADAPRLARMADAAAGAGLRGGTARLFDLIQHALTPGRPQNTETRTRP